MDFSSECFIWVFLFTASSEREKMLPKSNMSVNMLNAVTSSAVSVRLVMPLFCLMPTFQSLHIVDSVHKVCRTGRHTIYEVLVH